MLLPCCGFCPGVSRTQGLAALHIQCSALYREISTVNSLMMCHATRMYARNHTNGIPSLLEAASSLQGTTYLPLPLSLRETRAYYKAHLRTHVKSHAEETDPSRLRALVERGRSDAEWVVRKVGLRKKCRRDRRPQDGGGDIHTTYSFVYCNVLHTAVINYYIIFIDCTFAPAGYRNHATCSSMFWSTGDWVHWSNVPPVGLFVPDL